MALLLVTFFSAPIFAQQDLPRIAVYVTGDIGENEKATLGTRMLASLIRSGRYRGIERSGAFLAEIEKEQAKQRSGSIDDSQITELGRQFGVKYVCIANLSPAFGSFHLSARIVNVETAEVEFIGEAFTDLKSAQELTEVSNKVVQEMFSGEAKPEPKPVPDTQKTPPPPAVVSQAEPEPVAQELPPIVIPSQIKVEPTESQPKPELEAPDKKSIKSSFWLGLGLDFVGVGAIAYGVLEDGNVADRVGKGEYTDAEKNAKNRNAAYIAGAALLLTGISIHIFF